MARDKIQRLKERAELLHEREQMYHKQLLVISEGFGTLFNSAERVGLKWLALKVSDNEALQRFSDCEDLVELRAYLEGLEQTLRKLAPTYDAPRGPQASSGDGAEGNPPSPPAAADGDPAGTTSA